MLPADPKISLELSAIPRIVRVARGRPQEHDIEFGRQVREHVDSPYDILHERNTVARIVILVPADAFYEYLHVRPRNHHLLDLGKLW
jgi:hypothetical protein